MTFGENAITLAVIHYSFIRKLQQYFVSRKLEMLVEYVLGSLFNASSIKQEESELHGWLKRLAPQFSFLVLVKMICLF
jgi:hypothetical protein